MIASKRKHGCIGKKITLINVSIITSPFIVPVSVWISSDTTTMSCTSSTPHSILDQWKMIVTHTINLHGNHYLSTLLVRVKKNVFLEIHRRILSPTQVWFCFGSNVSRFSHVRKVSVEQFSLSSSQTLLNSRLTPPVQVCSYPSGLRDGIITQSILSTMFLTDESWLYLLSIWNREGIMVTFRYSRHAHLAHSPLQMN
jgi:hypothetical protein